MNKYQLKINEFRVSVHLGVSDAERATPQTVAINIEINFHELPLACQSDNIKETVCYSTLCKNILQFCQKKSFHLIEHLGYELYHHLLAQVSDYGSMWLSVIKTAPVANLKSSQFSIGSNYEL